MRTKKAVLDIGSDVITLVVQDDQYSNHFIFQSSTPYSGFQDGEFLDVEELFHAIGGLIRECKEGAFCEPEQFLIGVPGEFTTVLLKNVEMFFASEHKVTAADLDQLPYEGNTYDKHPIYQTVNASPIHYVLDDGTVTLHPTGSIVQKLLGYMSYVLAERKFINLFDQIAEANGVDFVYTSGLLSEMMYVVPTEARDKGVILVDSGYISTGVAYGKGDGLMYSVGISEGIGNIAGDLTFCKKIPFERTLNITEKLNFNLKYTDEDKYTVIDEKTKECHSYSVSEINDIAVCRVEDIASNIQRALDFCPKKIPEDAAVFLTGCGIANLVGAKDILARVLHRNVNILRPDCLQFNKPKHSALVGLLRVQQVTMSVPKWKAKLYNILAKFRRKTNA